MAIYSANGWRNLTSWVCLECRQLSRILALSLILLVVTGCDAKKDLAQTDKEPEFMVRMTTSLGVIEIELNEAAAPQTVQNFIEYANSGHYNGTIFHRVMPGFMIQGGGMSAGMQEKSTRSPIENEADNGLKNTVGTLAMARTNDPHSATTQFFINLVDNGFLDHTSQSTAGWGYAVFGRVTGGMDVVEQIAAVPTGTKGMHADVPLEDVEIKSVEIVSIDS